MISVHRATNRLTEDVVIPVRNYLIENAPVVVHSVNLGDGHICDRIQDRCKDLQTAVNNIKFLFMNCIEKHLCELLYLALKDKKTLKVGAVFKTGKDGSKETGIFFGFTIKDVSPVDSDCSRLVWKFSTYIPDYKLRERDPQYEMFYLN